MDTTLQGYFQQQEIINNLRHDSKACWATMATLYLDDTEDRTAFGNPGVDKSVCENQELGNKPAAHLFEKGIVDNFMCVKVRTNWIHEAAIKIEYV
jgi:hypothetical protein